MKYPPRRSHRSVLAEPQAGGPSTPCGGRASIDGSAVCRNLCGAHQERALYNTLVRYVQICPSTNVRRWKLFAHPCLTVRSKAFGRLCVLSGSGYLQAAGCWSNNWRQNTRGGRSQSVSGRRLSASARKTSSILTKERRLVLRQPPPGKNYITM